MRDEYLCGNGSSSGESGFGNFEPGTVVADEFADRLIAAARAFLAERSAMEYLARAEHSRFLLTQKLAKKGFSREDTVPALDYLQSRGYLDDARYAAVWLRSRSIHTTEGRLKLQAGLSSRGISGDIAKKALDEFCETHDETESCEKMAEKLISQGKSGDKLAASLVRRGFSIRLVRYVLDKKKEL